MNYNIIFILWLDGCLWGKVIGFPLSGKTTRTGGVQEYRWADLCRDQNQEPMKYFLALSLLLFGISLTAQIQVTGVVLSTAGHSGQNGAIAVNSTFGETFIFSRSETIYWGQGFQTNSALTVTSSFENEGQIFTLRMFPNPGADVLYVESDAPILALRLYNTMGQLVKTIRDFPTGGIDISALPPGIYTVQADIGRQVFSVGRMVKIRL